MSNLNSMPENVTDANSIGVFENRGYPFMTSLQRGSVQSGRVREG